ncbi:MAG: hypothetical protein EXS35_01915 [Pedosphaera sp.]|nr:hypothetical protein [Pedosphaera sp.]
MKLDENQRQKVAAWIADGLKLSEIQNRIGKELGVQMTYMEVRFLVDDLKLTPKDPEPPKPPAPSPLTAPAAAASPLAPEVPGADAPAGGVSVAVDQLARPGTMVSGKVTFSDGQNADWYLDQTGRLGVVPAVQGYKPAAADVQQFQLALQNELAKMGI